MKTIGDPLLTAFWVDPEFDPSERAFYYVRVIEIPKPRWTAYDAKFFGVDMPDEVSMTTRERATWVEELRGGAAAVEVDESPDSPVRARLTASGSTPDGLTTHGDHFLLRLSRGPRQPSKQRSER